MSTTEQCSTFIRIVGIYSSENKSIARGGSDRLFHSYLKYVVDREQQEAQQER